jgi:hypothetical protein
LETEQLIAAANGIAGIIAFFAWLSNINKKNHAKKRTSQWISCWEEKLKEKRFFILDNYRDLLLLGDPIPLSHFQVKPNDSERQKKAKEKLLFTVSDVLNHMNGIASDCLSEKVCESVLRDSLKSEFLGFGSATKALREIENDCWSDLDILLDRWQKQ